MTVRTPWRVNWYGLALAEEKPAGATVTPVEHDTAPELLATQFCC